MRIIEALQRETIYDFLERVLLEVKISNERTMKAKHNGVEIYVYNSSHIADLCDKFDIMKDSQFLNHNIDVKG